MSEMGVVAVVQRSPSCNRAMAIHSGLVLKYFPRNKLLMLNAAACNISITFSWPPASSRYTMIPPLVLDWGSIRTTTKSAKGQNEVQPSLLINH